MCYILYSMLLSQLLLSQMSPAIIHQLYPCSVLVDWLASLFSAEVILLLVAVCLFITVSPVSICSSISNFYS